MLGAVSVCAEEAVPSADEFIRSAEGFLREGREFRALEEYQKAIEKDNKRSETYGYLAILLYDLGFLDEAIEEMKKAVAFSPDSVYLNMELGKFYFARNSRGDAIEQFFSVLEMNPGHSSAYYYLGELLFGMKDYDMAWLSAKMARKMGQRGRGLIGKLRELSEEPQVDPWKDAGDELYIRQILLDTREEAEELVNRISAGELFEDLAVRGINGPSARFGGFQGKLEHSEVHPKIAEVLLKDEALSGPYIVDTEKGFHIVQRVVPFKYQTWEELLAEYRGKARKPEGPEAKVTKGEGPFIVFVGAFKKESNATQRVEDLSELGFPSYHIHRGEWFNVIAGRYNSYSEALESSKRIANQGYEFFITNEEGTGPDQESINIKKRPKTGTDTIPFIVFVGSFKEEKNAIQRVADLRELGFSSYHIHRGEWFHVIAGRYNSYSEALESSKRIANQGYEFFIPRVE